MDKTMTFLKPIFLTMKAAGNARITPIMAIALISVPNTTASSSPRNAGNSQEASGGILNWQ